MSDEDHPDRQPPELPPARIRTRVRKTPTEEGGPDQPATTAANDDDEYKVGYRRPPLHTRFKRGHSGNKAGRKPGQKSLRGAVTELLGKPIKVRSSGETVTMRQREAVAHRLVEKALSGDLKAILAVMKIEEGGNADEALRAAAAVDKPLTEDEQAILDQIFARREQDWSEDGEP